MAANSTVLINSTSHDNTAHDTPLVGEKFKGAGFYGLGDGFHTVQVHVTSFTGSIVFQGTLASDPTDIDWVDIQLGQEGALGVDTTGLISQAELSNIIATNQTIQKVYNFTGNFVWVRANITSWTAGSINRILLNF